MSVRQVQTELVFVPLTYLLEARQDLFLVICSDFRFAVDRLWIFMDGLFSSSISIGERRERTNKIS